MAKPIKFAHVVYMTRRFDEMIAWYRDVFEAEVVYQNPALAFLTYDDEHHRFAFANLDVLKPAAARRRPIAARSASITSPTLTAPSATCSAPTSG